MAFLPVEVITPPIYTAMQFHGTKEDGAEIVSALDWSLANGLIIDCYVKGYKEGENPPQWRVEMIPAPGFAPLVANAGMWIVLIDTGPGGEIEVLDDASYSAKYTVPAE